MFCQCRYGGSCNKPGYCMTQETFARGDCQAVLHAHPLESYDPGERLRYGSALLNAIQQGPKAGRQQQQAALAFVQGQKEGVSVGAVAAAQGQVVMVNLRQALELVGVSAPTEPEPPAVLRRERALDADFPVADPQAVALIKDPRQCGLPPLWKDLFVQRPFQVGVALVVRQPEAVAASLLSRDQVPLERALLLWLLHTMEAEREKRHLPWLVLSCEQLLQEPTVVVQRCWQLTGIHTTTPASDLLNTWILPALYHQVPSSDGLLARGEIQTLMDWADKVYQALVAPAAEPQKELLDHAHAVELAKGSFSEAASQSCSVMAEGGGGRAVFPLPASAASPLQLRLDLAKEPAMVSIRSIHISWPAATPIWQWTVGEVSPLPYLYGMTAKRAGAERQRGVGGDSGSVGCVEYSR